MESSSEPENDSSDQLQATPILLGIMMIAMMTVKMKQWLRIFNDNDVDVDDNNNGEIAVKQWKLIAMVMIVMKKGVMVLYDHILLWSYIFMIICAGSK